MPSCGYDRRRAHVPVRQARPPDDVGIASACAGGRGDRLGGRWLPSRNSARNDRLSAIAFRPDPHSAGGRGVAGSRVPQPSAKGEPHANTGPFEFC
jgi:hypothetical protein